MQLMVGFLKSVAAGVFIGASALLNACGPSEEAIWEAAARERLEEAWVVNPGATQIRRLRLSSVDRKYLCGEVNRQKPDGRYEGFYVFMLNLANRSERPNIAVPSAIQVVGSGLPLRYCMDANERRLFDERLRADQNRFQLDLDEYERETERLELQVHRSRAVQRLQ